MTPDVPAVNPGAVLSVSDFLSSEADLLDNMAVMVVRDGLTAAEAVQYLRDTAVVLRRVRNNLTAGRGLAL